MKWLTKIINWLVDTIFFFCYSCLDYISDVTRLSYNEVNIIVYYMIIPFIWGCMLDILFKTFIISPILLIFYLTIILINRKKFSHFCNVIFYKSQTFILFFGDYIKQSVVICVIIPIIITIILLMLIII